MLSNPVVFPLHGLVNGKCTCGAQSCTRPGKHPHALWRDLKTGDPVPRPEPGAGVGIKTGARPKGSGIFVVDLDSDEAETAFAELGPCPDTYTVKTARGKHLYFEHPGFIVANSASALAAGVDVRGDGGFVVGEGSPHVSGAQYERLNDVPPVRAPEWLLSWLQPRTAPIPPRANGTSTAVKLDVSETERRRRIYTEYLQAAPPCIQGQGGDTQLFRVVQHGALDLDLSIGDILELIGEHYDPRCVPPWGDALEERVRHKVQSARTASTREKAEPPPPDLEEIFGRAPLPPKPSKSETNVTALWLSPADRARRLSGQDLVRLKTGMPSIDTSVRGGLLLRKVVAIGGAPGAGKTALTVQFAFNWLLQGIHVTFLAADEDPDAILIRFGQLAGLSRDALESGDAQERERLAAWCETVPLMLIDGDDDGATVEGVSKALRESADGAPSVLVGDSIQTLRSAAPTQKGADARARINDVVRALKRAAKRDGHLVIATSEISKAAYRNQDQAENVNPLSAFKESGDIEYGVGLAIVLTSRQGTGEFADAVIAKNRLGHGKPKFFLRLDHTRAGIGETSEEVIKACTPSTPHELEILAIVKSQPPLKKTQIQQRIGGNKQAMLSIINGMLDAHQLHQERDGSIRLPLPGDRGYRKSGG